MKYTKISNPKNVLLIDPTKKSDNKFKTSTLIISYNSSSSIELLDRTNVVGRLSPKKTIHM